MTDTHCFLSTWWRLLAAAALVFVASSCGAPPERPDTGVEIVTTFHAVSTVVAPIVSPGGSIHVLVASGASPHAYEPRPSDIRRMTGADVLVLVGRGVDEWAADLADVTVIRMLDLVSDSLRNPTDPHFWLDPLAVKSTLPGLTAALCAVDRGGCPTYRNRASAFSASLDSLARAPAAFWRIGSGAGIVASGPFLAHWSRRFGPPIAGTIEQTEGVEPSAARVGAMIVLARESAGVVGQLRLPDEAARAVAEAAGVPYVRIDPVGTSETAPDYAGLLESIARSLQTLPGL